MAGLAGKLMRFDYGTGPLHMRVSRCRSTLRTQLVESTNSESLDGNGNSAEDFVFGVSGGDIDIDVVYNGADNPFPYATMGDGVSGTATFYPDKTQTGKKITGTLMIETFEFTGEVRGLITCRIAGKFALGRTVTSL